MDFDALRAERLPLASQVVCTYLQIQKPRAPKHPFLGQSSYLHTNRDFHSSSKHIITHIQHQFSPHEGACDNSLIDMAAGTLTSDHVNYLIWRYVIRRWLMASNRIASADVNHPERYLQESGEDAA